MPETRRRFITLARQRLLHQLMSGWRRRGTSLLLLGLNADVSPDFFWQAGFDVTVLDSSPERIAAAREQTGPKIEYVCGSPERLPFDDGAFDCAALLHHGLRPAQAGEGGRAPLALQNVPDGTPPQLAEALRVSSRGIILLEWNRFSLAGIPDCAGPAADQTGKERAGVLPWTLWSMVRRACPDRRVRLFSMLPLWECTWPDGASGPLASLRRAFTPLNLTPVPLPWGALLGLRVDWDSLPLTPAGVLRTAAESLCAANPRREEAIGRSMQASPVSYSSQERKEP